MTVALTAVHAKVVLLWLFISPFTFRLLRLTLSLCMLSNFPCCAVVCCLVSKFTFSKKFFQEHYQRVRLFGSRSGLTKRLVLIWVKTVCIGYRQTTEVTASEERVIPSYSGDQLTVAFGEDFWFSL